MKKIDVTTAPTTKVVTCEGKIVGALPLNSTVYGKDSLDGHGLLYAHNLDADVWYMITPAKIIDYPSAKGFVARGDYSLLSM